LLEAIPVPDPEVKPPRSVPVGEPPSPMAPPTGCRFRTRCACADGRCIELTPELHEIAPGRQVACHHPLIVV
jgi:peptide/nickel transport system ATP-binding protein